MLPWFTAFPPAGFGVLSTVGRRTSKTRRRCVRVIRQGDNAYLVSIGGDDAAWIKNIRGNPNVRIRMRGGTFSGVARVISDEDELRRAEGIFCGIVNRVDYLEFMTHLRGRPTSERIRKLHARWFRLGTPLVIELSAD